MGPSAPRLFRYLGRVVTDDPPLSAAISKHHRIASRPRYCLAVPDMRKRVVPRANTDVTIDAIVLLTERYSGVRSLRRILEVVVFGAAWAEGRRTPIEMMIDCALGRAPFPCPPSPLAGPKAETGIVLSRVANGRSPGLSPGASRTGRSARPWRSASGRWTRTSSTS